MHTLVLAGNITKMSVVSCMANTLLRWQLLQSHLIVKLAKMKEVLTWRNTILKQGKSYIGNILNSAKVNVTSNQRQFYSATECPRNSRWVRYFLGQLLQSLAHIKRSRFRVTSEKTT